MQKLIDLNAMSTEALAAMANEASSEALNHGKKSLAKAIDCGRYLDAAASQVPRGEWLAWQRTNLDFSQQTASKYRRLANYARERNLEAVETQNEAMRLMYDDLDTSQAASVTVVDPSELKSSGLHISADALPANPTNRQTSPENRPTPKDEQPPTRPVVAELVVKKVPEEVAEWLAAHSVEEIIGYKNANLTKMSFAGMAKRLHKIASKYESNVKP